MRNCATLAAFQFSMALQQLITSSPITTFTRFPARRRTRASVGSLSSNHRSSTSQFRFQQQQVSSKTTKATDQTIARRSATYQKHKWDYELLVESLTSKYVGEPYIGRATKLKAEVRMLLEKALKPLDQLELIDILQRLGLAYHFEDEIRRILKSLFHDYHIENSETKDDLYATALKFRLLRQHGHSVPQDVFNRFKDDQGNFDARFCGDLKGILNMYEASYHLVEGESILDDARHFAAKSLKKYVKQGNSSEYLSMLVSHALEAPLAWRVPKFDAMWFISVYEKKQNMEPKLLELAKLDFNMVQATHQEELKDLVRWCRNKGLAEKFDFLRVWPVEFFLWAVGVVSQPQFGYCRIMIAKVFQLICLLDDIYDAYGTLDELELFTEAIVRWDVNSIDNLPDYMKLYFLILYNSTNEMAYDILKDQGFHILPYLKKAWGDLSKSVMVEAKWYHAGYTPSLKEYLDNGLISISTPTILLIAYFSISNPITTEASKCLEECNDMIRWLSIVTRLLNDLATISGELKRGDVVSSIQCYMQETGASKEVACDYIKDLIIQTWKKINNDRFPNPMFSQAFIDVALNTVRTSHLMYQQADEYESVLRKAKDDVTSLLVQPI